MMFEGFADQGVSSDVTTWFDYWLKGIDNGQAHREVVFSIRNKKVNAANPIGSLRERVSYESWTPESTDKLRLYLDEVAQNRLLSLSQSSSSHGLKLLTADQPSLFGGDADTALILEGLLGQATKENIKRLNQETTAVFFSEPMLFTKIRGISYLNLHVRSLSQNPQVTIYLFAQPKRGDAKLITMGSTTITEWNDDEAKVRVGFQAIAYDLAEGERLAVVVDTKDFDFYAPPSQNNNIELLLGNGQDSFLELSFEK